MYPNSEFFQVGDSVTVHKTGNKVRKVVEVHDSHLMVERARYPPLAKSVGPAKIYFSQITYNYSEDVRVELEEKFYETIGEFEETLTKLAVI